MSRDVYIDQEHAWPVLGPLGPCSVLASLQVVARLVCRWCGLPTVWGESYGAGDNNPPLEAFLRHSHYIKDLDLNIDAPQEFSLTPCPNVLNHIVRICRINRSKSMDIVPVLELHDLEIEPTATATFWNLCTQLVSLDIKEVTVAELPVRSIIFDRLQRLELLLKSQNPIEHQLDRIARCSTPLANPITDHWSHARLEVIERLSMRGWLPLIGGTLSPFTDFNMSGRETLQGLDAISRPRNLDVFSTHLESLYVERVLDEDIIDGLPRVCEDSLKELSIGISFPLV
ncbi:MAG: hypothetical protein J3Q66DRAFT_439690 [Benniella sp.]|nr:MAG: hypothetical protein J3Q66DRAFT_439690 [Benniella sp.]